MLQIPVAKVAVLAATFAFDRPYTYKIPQPLADTLRPGCRVMVPFSRGTRPCEGMVLALDMAEDAPKLTDERMTQIAREYMQKMGITDTQYLLVRHLDQPHPHCHLVYNRVGDHGQTISDRNIKLRNAKVCRELTERFGLHLAPGKEAVWRERLREPD